MDSITREIVKTKIKSYKGIGFQDILDKILLSIHGEADFQRIKQKKDGGSDGILNGTTVIAAYAPEVYSLRDFKKKTSSDFKAYNNNWSSSHPNWQVFTNLEATAQMVQHVDSLKDGSPIICIEALLSLISKQTWTIKQLIFKVLEIPDTYLTNDVVSTAIEDLIQLSDYDNEFQPYDKPSYISDKIQLNVSEDNQATFMDEYEECLSKFSTINHILKSKSQHDISAIRSKVRSTFLSLSGTFELKLATMVETLCGAKKNDDLYYMNMRVLMVYFFEQCLYGAKTEAEIGND